MMVGEWSREIEWKPQSEWKDPPEWAHPPCITACPARRQPRNPPSMEITFVYPIFCRLSAASADRYPPPQYKTISASRLGILCSISLSMTPLPMWMADGRCPSAHSPSSRTSTR